MKRRTLIFLVAVVLVILLAAIAAVVVMNLLNFDRPETTVRDLELAEIDEDLRGFTLHIVLEVYNPNPFELEILDVEGVVRIDDEGIGEIYNRSGKIISGNSDGTLYLSVHIEDLDSMIVSGDSLTIEGSTRARYMGKEGSSPFEESLNLQDLPGSGENLPPVALIMGPRSARPLEEVTFDGGGSLDRDGEIVEYRWDLGDGSTGNGAQVTHRYTTPGRYNIRLTVEDDDGATNMAVHQIIISAL